MPLRGENLRTVAEFMVAAGQRIAFELAWAPTHMPEPEPQDAARSLSETEQWWQAWSGRCTYQGEWRAHVLRSLITLKALTYAPTGGVVAAATTSLPEQLGGARPEATFHALQGNGLGRAGSVDQIDRGVWSG